MSDKQSYQLQGKNLELAKEARDRAKLIDEKRQAMQQQHEQDMQNLHDDFIMEQRGLFLQICESLGVDPDLDWMIDLEHYDNHGVAFLVERKCSCGLHETMERVGEMFQSPTTH